MTSPRITYVNTDLDLISTEDLTDLAATLGAAGVPPLSVVLGDDGSWHATLETEAQFADVESNVTAILDAVESLDPSWRARWESCSSRELNVGYDCGEGPWAYTQGLTNGLLRRLAAAGLSLRLTLYPAVPEGREEE